MGDEDFADQAIDRVIDSKIEDKLDALETKLKAEQFLKSLEAAYPGWRTTWLTSQFQGFLREVPEDAVSGQPNHVFVEDAFRRLDAEAAMRFFKIFFEGRPRRKSVRTPGTFDPSSMSREQAKRELVKLADAKKKGLWDGREAEYQKRSDALTKVIMGLSE
jgi:hypothetical protein